MMDSTGVRLTAVSAVSVTDVNISGLKSAKVHWLLPHVGSSVIHSALDVFGVSNVYPSWP